MAAPRLIKIPTGLSIPRGGRCYDCLAHLLTPLVYFKDDKRIVIRTTREQIERYWHLIEDDPSKYYTR